MLDARKLHEYDDWGIKMQIEITDAGTGYFCYGQSMKEIAAVVQHHRMPDEMAE